MNWFEALVLGLIQGLTEYLPVSSSGHLAIGAYLFGIDGEANLGFTILVHVATVMSTLVVLWKEIDWILKGLFKFQMNEETKYALNIVVSMIPVGIVGVFFKDEVEKIFGSGLLIVGCMLLVTALLLAFSYYAKPRQRENISLWHAFVIGLGQALAVLPGLSRSGTTIATGLLLGNKKEKMAQFSFLRIIPPTLERLRRLSPTILRNGMPSLLRNALAAVAASILNLTAGGFGDAAVAAMSIVSRVLMTVNAVMVGLGQGYQPVAGFNWGAGNYARVKKALVSTIVAGTAFTTAAAIPGFIFSESIVSVFAGGDPEVMETGTTAMRWAFAGFPFIAVSMIANMTYQVLGSPKAASFLSSLRQGWCFLPLILTLPGWFGLTGLCASQPLAEVLATLVSLRWIRAIVLEADDLTAKKNASRKV